MNVEHDPSQCSDGLAESLEHPAVVDGGSMPQHTLSPTEAQSQMDPAPMAPGGV